MTDRQTMQARLEAVHSFPETYMFKVIGENNQDFIARVIQAATNAMGSERQLEIRTRESAAGRHVSVTLLAEMEDAESVLQVYDLLQVVQGVHFLL